jgi:hypothetical protein
MISELLDFGMQLDLKEFCYLIEHLYWEKQFMQPEVTVQNVCCQLGCTACFILSRIWGGMHDENSSDDWIY